MLGIMLIEMQAACGISWDACCALCYSIFKFQSMFTDSAMAKLG